jgi:hypothetical protein
LKHEERRDALVRPVLRRAALLTLDPAPTPELAGAYALALADRWADLQDEYLEVLAAAARSEGALEVSTEESIRTWRDRTSFVVDCPRVRGRTAEGYSFDTRLCVAVCFLGLTTKAWSRAGIPYDEKKDDNEVTADRLGDVIAAFRRITNATSEWSERVWVSATMRECAPNPRAETKGHVNVSVVAARDKRLGSFFEHFRGGATPLRRVLDLPGAEECFSRYLRELEDFDGPLRDLADDSDGLWFTSPTTIQSDPELIEARRVLYRVSSTGDGDTANAVGLGYDDSLRGDLSQESSRGVGVWLIKDV